MTITYHSQNRKELVKAISEIIGIPAVYQFMPTCAYKIGECYTVTKSGNLEISDQADREETERLLAELENQGYAVPDTSELESKSLTVQMPADFFTEHTLGNLRQICENKAALFQTAFQTDSLDIIPSDEKVEFPWFMVEQDGDADAYCTFISMLCEFAKNQSRINRKPDTSDNPKYTMRCFLIRLGMVGAEFKAARKVIFAISQAIPHSERLVILMQFPSESYLEQLRKKYPVGTKLQLISMRNEKYPVLSGTVGEVTHIDDAGSIHMRWENGSSLALIPEIDSFQTVSEAKE